MKFLAYTPQSPIHQLPFLKSFLPTHQTIIPCPERCYKEMYCCSECRDFAWNKWHSFLCCAHYPHLREFFDRSLSSFQRRWARIFPILDFEVILKIISQQISALQHIGDDLTHSETIFETLEWLSACPLSFREHSTWLIRNAYDVLSYIFNITAPRLFPHLQLTVDGLRRLVTKVLLNQQHLVLTAPFKLTNYLTAVTEHHGPEAEKEAIRYLAHIDSYLQEFNGSVFSMFYPEGSGLFVLHSTMNHSCTPNVRVSTDNDTHQIDLVALRDIGEGEELTFSYVLPEMTSEERKRLLEQYRIFCTCPKCQNKE
jgi:hypothetical protein